RRATFIETSMPFAQRSHDLHRHGDDGRSAAISTRNGAWRGQLGRRTTHIDVREGPIRREFARSGGDRNDGRVGREHGRSAKGGGTFSRLWGRRRTYVARRGATRLGHGGFPIRVADELAGSKIRGRLPLPARK